MPNSTLYSRSVFIKPFDSIGFYQGVRASSPKPGIAALWKVDAILLRADGQPSIEVDAGGCELEVIATTAGVTRTFAVDLECGQTFTVAADSLDVGVRVRIAGVFGHDMVARIAVCQVTAPLSGEVLLSRNVDIAIGQNNWSDIPNFAQAVKFFWDEDDVPANQAIRICMAKSLAMADPLIRRTYNAVAENRYCDDWIQIPAGIGVIGFSSASVVRVVVVFRLSV
jgi:hypothetical protein